jgi:LysM repeat protein
MGPSTTTVAIDPVAARAFADQLLLSAGRARDLADELTGLLALAELGSSAPSDAVLFADSLRRTAHTVHRRADEAEAFQVRLQRHDASVSRGSAMLAGVRAFGSPSRSRPRVLRRPTTPRATARRSSARTADATPYTVQPGDTLWAIARRHGLRWPELAAYNGLRNPHLVRPGQVIRVPNRAARPAGTRTAGAPTEGPTSATTRATSGATALTASSSATAKSGSRDRRANARAAYLALKAAGARVDGFNASSAEHKAVNPNSDHDRGLAFDWHVKGPAALRKALAIPGVRYVIHDRRIYHRNNGFRPQPYTGRFANGRRKDPHANHIHVNF